MQQEERRRRSLLRERSRLQEVERRRAMAEEKEHQRQTALRQARLLQKNKETGRYHEPLFCFWALFCFGHCVVLGIVLCPF